MSFAIQLEPSRRAAMRAAGLWPDRLFTDDLDEAVRTAPEATAIVAARAEGGTVRLCWRELADAVQRIALGLAELGVGRGQVVSFQLPNWWQFVAVYLACVRIGAVANPLVPIFRQRELRFMLRFAESRVVIAPARFRGFDHGAMLRELRPDLPDLRRVLLVGGEGDESFEKALLARSPDAAQAQALFRERRPGPDELTQLMYTSGTTGEPKGVMHTHNTLIGTALRFMATVGLTQRDAVLMPSPLGHQSGFLYGMGVALALKTRLVLQDVWNPGLAAELIAREEAGYTFASAAFLADLANHPGLDAQQLRSLRYFVCSGAPIPGALVERASRQLGFRVLSGWGMTENGIVTVVRPDDPPEHSSQTDGCAIPGMEVRVVGEDHRPLPPGQVGHLQARGGGLFVGYLKRPELAGIAAEGWFDTGDLARMDERGYLRITGRSKDVIIRGGENIPVVEVEALLYRHPAVLQAAIVAYPDERLGERACAFVVPRPGASIDLASLVEFLKAQQLAVQYLPERIELRESLPCTPSGKVQKFRLRELLQEAAP
jgi:cyclohexanecarboxylate-CoA ligase